MKKKNTMQKIKLISAVLLLTIIIVFVWYFIWTWTRLGNNGIEYGELVGHEYISVDRVYTLRFADEFVLYVNAEGRHRFSVNDIEYKEDILKLSNDAITVAFAVLSVEEIYSDTGNAMLYMLY